MDNLYITLNIYLYVHTPVLPAEWGIKDNFQNIESKRRRHSVWLFWLSSKAQTRAAPAVIVEEL